MKTPLEFSGRSSSDPEELAIGRSHELTDLITHFAKQQPISEFYIWFKEFTILDQNFPNQCFLVPRYIPPGRWSVPGMNLADVPRRFQDRLRGKEQRTGSNTYR